MSIALTIPALGDDDVEGTVASICVAIGSLVQAGDILLEIETDKVVVEIPAQYSGTMTKIIVACDDTVTQGIAFAEMDTLGEAQQVSPEKPASAALVETKNSAEEQPQRQIEIAPVLAKQVENPVPATLYAAGPAVRRLARELGVDLGRIHGSGVRGRISKDDLKRFVKAQLENANNTHAATSVQLPDLTKFGPVIEQKLSRLENTVASNTQASWSEIPHAWVSQNIDVGELEQARKRLKSQSSEGAKNLTITAILIKVLAVVLTEFPRFKAAFNAEKQSLVIRDYCHIAVAVDTKKGLVVPVIRDADKKNGFAIAAELHGLGDKARTNQLTPVDLQGAGFTVSNLGGLGCTALMPMVNWPQVAILGVASSQQSLQLNDDNSVGSRLLMPVTLGFDHRVINGADAARFLSRLKILLEEPLLWSLTI